MARKRKKRYRHRDARTGKFVPRKYADNNPARTIRETVKQRPRRRKK